MITSTVATHARRAVASTADMLYALVSSDVVEALPVDRRWSRRRLAEHLSRLFRAMRAADDG